MQSLSISRFLILSIVAKHGPMEIGSIQRYYHRVPSEQQRLCAVELGEHTIRGVVCYLVTEGLILRNDKFIGVTDVGMRFYLSYLQILGTLREPISIEPSKSKKPKNEKDCIESKKLIKPKQKQPHEGSVLPEVPKNSVNKEIPSNNYGIFSTWFLSIIKDYHWNISELKLTEIIQNMVDFWRTKPLLIHQKSNYPDDTTAKMIGWLGLTYHSCGQEGLDDIKAGLQMCWEKFHAKGNFNKLEKINEPE